MKTLKLLVLALIVSFSAPITAQTADEIVANYLEAIGGEENLLKVQGIKMQGELNAQGMTIPLETVTMKDGRMYAQIEFQGKKIKQMFTDGTKVWMFNMMAQTTEEMPADETKMILEEFKDFPNPFLNYKDKGYTIELLGTETQEGTECFKIKLTKTPHTIKGETVPNISFYYFETDSFVPILTEAEVPSGPAKGQMMKTPLSDYQEVDGIYFPFTTQVQGMTMNFKSIILNPEVKDADFAKPEEAEKTPAIKN